MIELLDAQGMSVWVYQGADWLVPDIEGPHVAREAWTVRFDPTPIDSFASISDGVAKVVGVSDDHDAVHKAAALVRERFGDQVSAARSQPYYADVTNPHANKGAVVNYLSATYDIALNAEDPALVVRFQLPTVGDLRAAMATGTGDTEAVVTDLLTRCVTIVADGPDGFGRDGLDASARDLIATAMAERDPQAEIELDLSCPSCGTPFAVVFDTSTFLLQELDVRAARVLEEVHALAFHYHWSEREILAMAPTRRERYLTLLADALGGADAAGYSAT